METRVTSQVLLATTQKIFLLKQPTGYKLEDLIYKRLQTDKVFIRCQQQQLTGVGGSIPSINNINTKSCFVFLVGNRIDTKNKHSTECRDSSLFCCCCVHVHSHHLLFQITHVINFFLYTVYLLMSYETRSPKESINTNIAYDILWEVG